MSDSSPTISVVLLSYNRPAMLHEALLSLVAQSYTPCEIILVDNRSPASDEVARVASGFSLVKLIRLPGNTGFAAGMNRGIAEAAGQFIYLTEDDITLDKDCLRHLVEHASRCGRGAIFSSVMYNKAAGTIRHAGGEFALGGVYGRKAYGEGQRDEGQFSRPFKVSYVDGAVTFARTNFLRELKGFREEYFMYVEAVEFCARVLKIGGSMTVVPQAKVYHFEPPDDAISAPGLDFHKYKNLFSLYLLHAPVRHLPEFFCRYALLALARASFGVGGDARALLKALRWTVQLMPSLLKERRAAPVSLIDTQFHTVAEGSPNELLPGSERSVEAI